MLAMFYIGNIILPRFYCCNNRISKVLKPQPLSKRITAGKAAKIFEASELHPESMLEAEQLEDAAADLYGEDIPAPSDYLSARQKDGKPLGADALFIETWKWLKDRGCEKFVNPRLIEAFCRAGKDDKLNRSSDSCHFVNKVI